MQNSELYRRGFVVPLNKEAELLLRNNNVSEETNVDFFEIPTEESFENLWEKGLFERINNSLGTMIDDYEEEIIENDKLDILIETVEEFINSQKTKIIEANVISELIRLCNVALKNRVPIFIIL